MKETEYIKLRALMKRKFAKLKMQLDEFEMQMSDLDELIETKTTKAVGNKLIKRTLKAIEPSIDELENKMSAKVASNYYEYVKNQTDAIVTNQFKMGVNFKHRVIPSEFVHEYEPVKMMNEGWRIVYVGPLMFETGKRRDVFIFERACKTKELAKVSIKGKRKAKVVRNPK